MSEARLLTDSLIHIPILISTDKKRMRQAVWQQQGLSNPGWSFHQNNACGKLDSNNKAFQILGGHVR